MTDKVKVLQVVESCAAGTGRHVSSLCEDLIAQGHQVTVAYAPYHADAAFEKFIMVHRNEIDFVPIKLRHEISPVSDLAGLFQLVRLIWHKGPFDVVHGHSSKGGAIARLAGRLSGLPTVYTPHGLNMASPRVAQAKLAANALVERILGYGATSKIISVSEGEREFIRKLKLTPKQRVCVINNGVDVRDLDYFSKQRVARGTIDEKPLTFGSVMRFSPPKTPGHLVEAFDRLCAAMPYLPMRLSIAGDGELLTGVRRQVRERGLNEKVSLLGWRMDINKLMLGFDVFVLSSLSEGGSYTVLDAMTAGLPVVSTKVFGAEETIAQVPGNVLVPAGDPEILASGMRRIANLDVGRSPRRALEQIGQANRDYIRSHFTQSDTTRRTLEVYRELRSIEKKEHSYLALARLWETSTKHHRSTS
jgi:glycosyltransferase involved in cell wall biosynthesis